MSIQEFIHMLLNAKNWTAMACGPISVSTSMNRRHRIISHFRQYANEMYRYKKSVQVLHCQWAKLCWYVCTHRQSLSMGYIHYPMFASFKKFVLFQIKLCTVSHWNNNFMLFSKHHMMSQMLLIISLHNDVLPIHHQTITSANHMFNSLRTEQNGCEFWDIIFKCIFSCDQAAMRTVISICPSVCLSDVTFFSQCSCHCMIIKCSVVITNDRNDVHPKCQGQR